MKRGVSGDRLKHVGLLDVAVPELTRSVDIKLNNGVSLQRRPERRVISYRTIFPQRSSGPTGKAVRRICPRLAALFLRSRVMLIESREIDPGVQPAGAEGALGRRLAAMGGHPTEAIVHRPAGFRKGLETARWQGGSTRN